MQASIPKTLTLDGQTRKSRMTQAATIFDRIVIDSFVFLLYAKPLEAFLDRDRKRRELLGAEEVGEGK